MSHVPQLSRGLLRASRSLHRRWHCCLLPTLTPPAASPPGSHRLDPSRSVRTRQQRLHSHSNRHFSASASTSSPPASSPPSTRGVLSTFFTASTIQYVADDLELRTLIAQSSGRLVVVDWFATWCGPCQAIAPVYEQLSEQHKDVLFIGADIEEMPDASAQAGVQSVPCFHFIKGGELVAVLTGADEVKLKELIKQHG